MLIGWLIIIVGASPFLSARNMVLYVAFVLAMTAILIAICYAKGEPPRWRWGK